MSEAGRFLRDPDSRIALYLWADGKCQMCGKPLGDSWHADHKTPWVVSHNTNLFEMQALCAGCNTRKGAKIPLPHFEIQFDGSEIRRGQMGAYNTVYDLIRTRKKNRISVQLPTGYGKSDVIRMLALALRRDGLVSNALIIEPNKQLREQILDQAQNQKFFDRYKIPSGNLPWPFSVNGGEEMNRLFHRNYLFASMTTGLANANKHILANWVKAEERKHGVPPVLFIDEAHTSSSSNSWGEISRDVADAGGFVVLTTATPFRTDGRQIPGFQVEEVDSKPVRVALRSGETTQVNLFDATKRWYRLVADWVTTNREAWDENDPPTMCKVTYQPFEVPLTKDGEVRQGGKYKLSDLGERDARRVLRHGLRNPLIIEQACRLMVKELRSMQLKPQFRSAAFIIFVGDDQNYDVRADSHAKEVRDALSTIAPEMRCVVATSNEEGAEDLIAGFQTAGDILIVKQMGGVGTDIPRVKGILDLSTTRAANSFHQRIMRAGRIWRVGDGPDEIATSCMYIAPADIMAQTLFNQLVLSDAGGSVQAVIEDFSLIGEVEAVPRQQDDIPPEPVYIPTGEIALPDKVRDTERKKVGGEMLHPIDVLCDALPGLRHQLTKPEIGEAIQRPEVRQALKIIIEEHPASTPAAPQPEQSPQNWTRVHKEKSKQVSAAARQIGAKLFVERHGRPYRSGGPASDSEIFRQILTEDVYPRHKVKVRRDSRTKTADMEINELEEMYANMMIEVHRG